ncbi:MAG: LamG-like jellyroll fold domain-containing protein [Verrucomicrobiales bacterium]
MKRSGSLFIQLATWPVGVSILLAFTLPLGILASDERNLPVTGAIAEDGASVTLSWSSNEERIPSGYEVSRRELGQEESDTWQLLATLDGSVLSYTDTTTVSGIAYEYQVFRPLTWYSASDIVYEAGGYWTTGIQLPVVEERGILLLVIDQTFRSSLSLEIDRLEADLRGDGWEVVRYETPRHDGLNSQWSMDLRSWIRTEYSKNPDTQHALFLLGRVPYVKSGEAAPDGHDLDTHATDLYYADIDGIWTDSNTNRANLNIPGDGIFDQNTIPTADPDALNYAVMDGTNRIEMWVGRVDFADMTADSRDEVTMLRDYLNKDHAYRQVRYEHVVDSYVSGMAYDESPSEENGVYNIVGPANVVGGGHENRGQEAPALWGVNFADWNGSNYPNYDIKTTFTINFGSAKQKWAESNNAMRATIAQRWWVLTCGWGVRPNWYIHHMALGMPIGYSHYRTANNGRSATPTQASDYIVVDDYGDNYGNTVWINLMGDPTLRAFMPAPPEAVTAREQGGTVLLNWEGSPSASIEGYRVYRAPGAGAPFVALNGGALVSGTTYTDSSPIEGAHYMIRAQRLETVHAGSFYNLSQGAFAAVGNQAPEAPELNLTTPSGIPLQITLAGSDCDGDALLLSRTSEASHGRLDGTGATMLYTPDTDFYGVDQFTYSVWDGTTEAYGVVNIQVLEPTVPPAITQVTPNYVSSLEGKEVTLSVDFEGDLPMFFQWYRNGEALSDGIGIDGVFNDTLTLKAPSVADSGDYHVELTNSLGTDSNEEQPIPVAIREESLGDALVLHYSFDEGSGTAIGDSSPVGADQSTSYADATWAADGKFGSCFGASTSSWTRGFTVADSEAINFDPQGDSYTISLWIRTTNVSHTYRYIYTKNTQFRLRIGNSVTRLELYNGGDKINLDTAGLSTGAINDGNWHLLTVVNWYSLDVDAWRTSFYYDGTLIQTVNSGTSVGTTSAELELASLNSANPLIGQLDDFRIYRKAMRGDEVAELYANTLPATKVYEDWASGIDWNGADPAPDAVSSAGVPNLLLYAMDAAGPSEAGSQWPGTFEWDPASGKFCYDYRVRSQANDIYLILEESENLIDWTPVVFDSEHAVETILDPDPDGDGSAILKRIQIPQEGTHRFYRHKVGSN